MGTLERPVLIQGGRVIDPATGRDEVTDVYIGSDGRIVGVGEGLAGSGTADADVIDATGRWVLPGFVDLHVHFREPGHEYKETVESGSRAAVAGGFTTVCCMANTNPVNDTGTVTKYIAQRADEAGLCRVLPIGAVSRGLKGEELAEISDMVSEGAVAVSDDGYPVMDAHLMRRALEYARTVGVPVVVHEEDSCLSGGCMHEGRVSTELGLPGIPAAAEDVMVARDIVLAEITGGHLHVAHVSTAGAVRMIREAQARGLKVTTEATPHHFTLTDEAVRGYDPATKMAPPLRTGEDVDAVIAGLKDGTIACVATDHAPHSTVEKEVEFEIAAFGIVGLETAWGLTYRLVQEGKLELVEAVKALTSGPAAVFGLDVGTLKPGASADVTIVDPKGSRTISNTELYGKSTNTPFHGWELPTRVERTLFGGRTVYLWDGERGHVGDTEEVGLQTV
ncbi:MAG: dihydroorotase [Proteobacteria bacterium]|nr:dihydroorotase [Pseudomonadota bacterium]